MSEGTFSKVGESDEPMYGPRAILVCGYTPSEQDSVVTFLNAIRLTDVPLIFATDADTETHLAKLLALPDQTGRNTDGTVARAMILSGVTEKELQKILSSYKATGLPRPLWATLTPFSENWTLASLLEELEKERIATRGTS